jgi:hypothetical protein
MIPGNSSPGNSSPGNAQAVDNSLPHAGATTTTGPLHMFLELRGEMDSSKWENARKFYGSILNTPFQALDEYANLGRLQNCASAEAILSLIKELETNGNAANFTPEEWENMAQQALAQAELPMSPCSVPIVSAEYDGIPIENVESDPNSELDGEKGPGLMPVFADIEMLSPGRMMRITMENNVLDGTKVRLVRKAFPEDFENAECVKQENLSIFRGNGMVSNANASFAEHSLDLASRNLVLQGIAEKVCELSGSKNLANPIVKTWIMPSMAASGTDSQGLVDICMEPIFSIGELSDVQRADSLPQLTFLQLLDIVAGNVCRGPEDVMFSEDVNGNCRVRGISNSFILSTNTIGQFTNGNARLSLESVPHVDRKVFIGILSLRPYHLAKIFLMNGRKLDAEFIAVCRRLEACQAYLRNLDVRGGIIDGAAGWQSLVSDGKLNAYQNSYANETFVTTSLLERR